MVEQMRDGGRGEAVRDGIRVAILGPPNAGKSSLLNLLAQRDAAIVSPTAGTTRDVVSVTLELAGLPVIIADTAGLRSQTDDPIEVQGMQRARAEARRAHLQLWVYDAATPPEDIALLSASASGDAHSSDGDDPPVPRLLVLNKVDLLSNAAAAATPCSGFLPDRQWHISCLTQQGVQPFLDSLSSLVGSIYGGDEREAALVTRARHSTSPPASAPSTPSSPSRHSATRRRSTSPPRSCAPPPMSSAASRGGSTSRSCSTSSSATSASASSAAPSGGRGGAAEGCLLRLLLCHRPCLARAL